MKCCTRAGVQDQVSPCSIRSRDISAMSRASVDRASPNMASSDIASTAAVSIGGKHEFVDVTRLERRMPGIRNHAKVRFGPCPMQIPGAGRGAHDVVAPLHDGRRNVADARDIVEQLRFAAQKAAIDEVMRFDSRNGEGELVLAPLADIVGIALTGSWWTLPTRTMRAPPSARLAGRCRSGADGRRAGNHRARRPGSRLGTLPNNPERSPRRRAGTASGFRRSAAGRCRAGRVR